MASGYIIQFSMDELSEAEKYNANLIKEAINTKKGN